jgi:hypothetical protein
MPKLEQQITFYLMLMVKLHLVSEMFSEPEMDVMVIAMLMLVLLIIHILLLMVVKSMVLYMVVETSVLLDLK